MKLVGKLIAAVIVIAVLAVIGVFVYIDSIAKAGVEAGGTYALGVETTLDGMDVGVLSGSVEMDELKVANPSGFDTPHFLRLGNGRIDVSLGSLMEDKVVVPELVLSGISMNLENKGGTANYKAILDGMKKAESKDKAAPADSKEGKKFVVQHVLINDVKVQADLLPIGGKLTRVPLTIERIELKDVGTDSDEGVLLAELTNILMKAILTSVAEKGGGLIPADITNGLTAGLKGLEGLGGVSVKVVGDVTAVVDGQVKKVGEIGAGIMKGVGDGGKKATEGLKDAAKKVDTDVKDAGKKLEKGIGNLLSPGKKK